MYKFITEKEQEIENENLHGIDGIQGLKPSSAIIMCGIRQLQYKYLNYANMNAHNYSVLMNQVPNLLESSQDVTKSIGKMSLFRSSSILITKFDNAKELSTHHDKDTAT